MDLVPKLLQENKMYKSWVSMMIETKIVYSMLIIVEAKDEEEVDGKHTTRTITIVANQT